VQKDPTNSPKPGGNTFACPADEKSVERDIKIVGHRSPRSVTGVPSVAFDFRSIERHSKRCGVGAKRLYAAPFWSAANPKNIDSADELFDRGKKRIEVGSQIMSPAIGSLFLPSSNAARGRSNVNDASWQTAPPFCQHLADIGSLANAFH